MSDVEQTRAEELAQRLEVVRGRVAAACVAVGREPGEVGLSVVTKFFPASDVRVLAGLGVGEVAENRHQEAVEKAQACADLDLRWHMVGGLQSNKAAAVAEWADVVSSVDRRKLLAPLARGAERHGRALDVHVQVSLDPPGRDHRAGVEPAGVAELAEAVVSTPGLRLVGLMAVAPTGGDPAEAFARLATTHRELLRDHPGATEVSAGMSGDLEAAIAAGATRVRVGSAVLGQRPVVA